MYLQHFPDSATAINLKACNHYRLYNGKAAEVIFMLYLNQVVAIWSGTFQTFNVISYLFHVMSYKKRQNLRDFWMLFRHPSPLHKIS